MIKKENFDELVKKYENKNFIENDPIQFPHRFQNKSDVEIAGFLASIHAYGSRPVFISKLNKLFEIMDNSPTEFIRNFDNNSTTLDNFSYRFAKGCDIKEIILILKKLYKEENSSLGKLFEYGWNNHHNVQEMLIIVCDYFYSNIKNEVSNGFYHLIPNARKGSALKRMNMFLRWMIRDGEVDLGIWNFMPKSELIIPLDTHVARISQETGLINIANNSFKNAQKITNELKKLDTNDPIKYDFALFGFGIDNPKKAFQNI